MTAPASIFATATGNYSDGGSGLGSESNYLFRYFLPRPPFVARSISRRASRCLMVSRRSCSFFPRGQRELHLGVPVRGEVDPERHQPQALLLCLAGSAYVSPFSTVSSSIPF